MAEAAQKIKVARIGVRIPAPTGTPPLTVLNGAKASVYDMDTGVLLPAEIADLHIPADGIITATVRVIVSEVVTDA